MGFGSKFTEAFAKNLAERKVDVREATDGLQNGLMKVHEFVGHSADVIVDHIAYLAVDMQDGIMKVSETIEDYVGLLEAVNKANTAPVQDETGFTKFVNYNESNTQDWTTGTRDEKIAFITNYFGLKNNDNTTEVYKNYTDAQLDDVIKIIRKYRS